MQLYTIHTNILTPFVNETIKALDTMANMHGIAGQARQDPLDEFKFKGFSVCLLVKSRGVIEGKIIMNYDVQTALRIGNNICAKMLADTSIHATLDEVIGDALAEFSNTAIGLATDQLRKAHLKITISPPLFITKPEDTEFFMDGVEEILTIPIDVEDVGCYYLSYLLHQRTE